ncbi:hypothetical protein CN155_32460 [Sinorhizobium meliloti]|nr:hypothetical protein CN155_32460 [Sinorhizobium meliloti]
MLPADAPGQIVSYPRRGRLVGKWQTASFEMPTSKKIGFARKGERHMLLHICCSASATVDVVHLLKIVCSRKV